MVKAIGNLTANLRASDKVSYRTKARFTTPSPLHAPAPAAKAAGSGKKAVKYKTRKK